MEELIKNILDNTIEAEKDYYLDGTYAPPIIIGKEKALQQIIELINKLGLK